MSSIVFRNFEMRDVKCIYHFKNHRNINDHTVGNYKEISYEEAERWVEKCIYNDSSYKYWVIATNDENQEIIGWCGLCNIDDKKKKAGLRGITIVDSKFRFLGKACYETCIFLLEYVFETLKYDSLYTITLETHRYINSLIEAFFPVESRKSNNSIVKNGGKLEILVYEATKEQYFEAKRNGDLEFQNVFCRLKNLLNKKL